MLNALQLADAPAEPADTGSRPLRVLLLADKKDHGPDEHDYPRWQERWALWLGGKSVSDAEQINLYGPPNSGPDTFSGSKDLEVVRAQGFPTQAQFAAADVVVAFCYIPWNHDHRQQLRDFLQRGGGLVLIHSATWTMPKADPEIADLVGVGGFTQWRHGPVQLTITAPDHPICKALPRQLQFYDESYWPPTPPPDPSRVTVLAVSQEEDAPGQAPAPQPMLWTAPSGRGRVFGCVLGHYSWTFDDPWSSPHPAPGDGLDGVPPRALPRSPGLAWCARSGLGNADYRGL
ncbi:MAG: ThuA domain-containing protein [Verrucomicrobiia bacterium]